MVCRCSGARCFENLLLQSDLVLLEVAFFRLRAGVGDARKCVCQLAWSLSVPPTLGAKSTDSMACMYLECRDLAPDSGQFALCVCELGLQPRESLIRRLIFAREVHVHDCVCTRPFAQKDHLPFIIILLPCLCVQSRT